MCCLRMHVALIWCPVCVTGTGIKSASREDRKLAVEEREPRLQGELVCRRTLLRAGCVASGVFEATGQC